MIENLNKEQLAGILETIPVELSFVDENDIVKFWNKHETRIFKRPVSAIGKAVQNCHPKQSVHKVNQILSDLKSGNQATEPFTRSTLRKIRSILLTPDTWSHLPKA